MTPVEIRRKATKSAIKMKMKRKNDPVSSLNQLAREFGVQMKSYATSGPSAPKWFKAHVMDVVGKKAYMKIRDGRQVRS
jgi:hypothetical protein